jgi:hypothetical protein
MSSEPPEGAPFPGISVPPRRQVAVVESIDDERAYREREGQSGRAANGVEVSNGAVDGGIGAAGEGAIVQSALRRANEFGRMTPLSVRLWQSCLVLASN